MPVDAAVRRDGRAWTQADELAALQAEQLDRWGAAFVSLMCGKKTQIPAPLNLAHTGRPSSPEPVKPQKQAMSIAEFAAQNPERGR